MGLIGTSKKGKTLITKMICLMDVVKGVQEQYYFGSKCDFDNPWSFAKAADGKVILDCPDAGDFLALDNEKLKQLIDGTVDDFPEKHEKESTPHPRTWIIWFSSNDYQVIADDTTTRRMWCIEILDDDKFVFNKKFVEEMIPQLWAQWYQMYLDLEDPNNAMNWCTTPDEYKMLDESNQRFKCGNSFAEWLDKNLVGKNSITTGEIREHDQKIKSFGMSRCHLTRELERP